MGAFIIDGYIFGDSSKIIGSSRVTSIGKFPFGKTTGEPNNFVSIYHFCARKRTTH